MCALRFGSFEPVRANVYPTNIRLNGGMTNVTASSATGLLVTYLLNEPASAGVSVVIKSNATTVRTIFGETPAKSMFLLFSPGS